MLLEVCIFTVSCRLPRYNNHAVSLIYTVSSGVGSMCIYTVPFVFRLQGCSFISRAAESRYPGGWPRSLPPPLPADRHREHRPSPLPGPAAEPAWARLNLQFIIPVKQYHMFAVAIFAVCTRWRGLSQCSRRAVPLLLTGSCHLTCVMAVQEKSCTTHY